MSSRFVRLLFAISPTIPLKNTEEGVRGRWDEMWGFLFRSNKETLIFVKSVSESLGSSTLNKEKTNPFRQILVMRTKRCLSVLLCPFKGALINYSHGQKFLEHICICGALFKSYMPSPSPNPQTTGWTRLSRIFPESQLCIGWGEGELQDILYCFMRASRKLQKITNTGLLSQGHLHAISTSRATKLSQKSSFKIWHYA